MKKTLALLIALAISNTALAKVNYDDAISSNDQYYSQTESVHITPSNQGLEGFELQDTSSGDGWTQYWSGSTTGGIGIPRSAKEVFVRYTTSSKGTDNSFTNTQGYNSFPVNGGTLVFAKGRSTRSFSSDSCSVTTTGNFANFVVSGSSASDGWYCQASVIVNSVMYR